MAGDKSLELLGIQESLSEIASALRDLVEISKHEHGGMSEKVIDRFCQSDAQDSQMTAAIEQLQRHVNLIEDRIAKIAEQYNSMEAWKSRLEALERRQAGQDELNGSFCDRLDALEADVKTIAGFVGRIEAIERGIAPFVDRIAALDARLDANEQAVQSCLSSLGEVNKVVQTLAAGLAGDEPQTKAGPAQTQ
jgi:chromosome segregation ATPase